MLAKIGDDKAHKVEAPAKTLEELTEKLNSLTKNNGTTIYRFVSSTNLTNIDSVKNEEYIRSVKNKKSLFSKVKSIFKR